MTLSVLVRGAGVAGLCCAVTLAERGARVVLAESGDAIGSGASWKAGGMLAPWCEAETAPPGLVEQALPSLDWWRHHVPETESAGTLVLALSRDGGEIARMARRTAEHRWVEGAELAALEPDLADRFSRGLFFAGEAHLDPRRALPALAERLHALGGTVLLNQSAQPDGTFDHVVDARGIGSEPVLPELRGVRGEMLLLRVSGVTLHRPIRLLHPRFPLYLVPRENGVVMLGATMIESEDRGKPRVRSVMELLSAAFALHPAFGEAEILEMSADLRPSLPDNMPRVQERDGVLHVNGMFRHGFLMGPVLAGEVADRIMAA